ncbi:hypothetical protein HDV05_005381 [Chytridiales sp. JEL 0842]|nr:hypothetical protein HDV05_005381 [Chytridiales sp. JEL 0842]
MATPSVGITDSRVDLTHKALAKSMLGEEKHVMKVLGNMKRLSTVKMEVPLTNVKVAASNIIHEDDNVDVKNNIDDMGTAEKTNLYTEEVQTSLQQRPQNIISDLPCSKTSTNDKEELTKSETIQQISQSENQNDDIKIQAVLVCEHFRGFEKIEADMGYLYGRSRGYDVLCLWDGGCN